MSTYRFGFLAEQVAGHVTNYRNLREVAELDREITADFHEIGYHKEGGWIERLRQRVPLLPQYATGIARASWDTRRGLRHARYDALFSNVTVSSLFSGAFRETPTLIDLDSTPAQIDRMPEYGSPDDARPVAALKKWLWRRAFHAAAIIQAWSHWAKRSVVEDYGVPERRVDVNPPGVKLDWWTPAAKLDGLGKSTKILFVGGDFTRKGGHLLLDWYRSAARPGIELHFVTRELVTAGAGVFVYPDMQPNSERLLALYQSSDLFVLPSLAECFGIATIEAMAAGLPVIASDVGGTADIILPGRNGLIVRAGDVRDLGGAIERILGDEALRRVMATQSRELAETRFDVRTNARRTLASMKRIARERDAGSQS